MIPRWSPNNYSRNSQIQLQLGKELIQLADIEPSEKVLDVGCGPGRLTAMIAKKQDVPVVGVDLSLQMIQFAQHKYRKLSNLIFLVGDGSSFRYQWKFDVVFSNSALHWINNKSLLFTNLKNNLLAGGKLAIQTGIKGTEQDLLSICKHTLHLMGRQSTLFDASIWNMPTKQEISALLIRKGFMVQKLEEVNFTYPFKTATQACNFFESAGLQPVFQILPAKDHKIFMKYFRIAMSDRITSQGVSIQFKRLVIIAVTGSSRM